MHRLNKATAVKVILLFFILTILTGICYPLVVTGISQVAFREKANGSIIEVDGKKYGSVLLAQEFVGEEYLWGRIMKLDVSTYTDGNGKNLMYAEPSNLSPASEEYKKLVAERVRKLKASHPEDTKEGIPVDLVTSSGSGLDPHISPAAAAYQVQRIVKARGLSEVEVSNVIEKCTKGRLFGVLGEKTVNVLKVNLMLDGIL